MSQQRTSKKSGAKRRSGEQAQPEPASVDSKTRLAETDTLLAEIDELIADVNAEEFVRHYVQKGGQ